MANVLPPLGDSTRSRLLLEWIRENYAEDIGRDGLHHWLAVLGGDIANLEAELAKERARADAAEAELHNLKIWDQEQLSIVNDLSFKLVDAREDAARLAEALRGAKRLIVYLRGDHTEQAKLRETVSFGVRKGGQYGWREEDDVDEALAAHDALVNKK